ncbi:MAG: methyltransferase domain-containing protein [Patescibacteria group bacterium]
MSLAYKISAFNRRRKYQRFLEVLKPRADTTILDVGFTEEEYSASDNFLEKNYPWPENITALGLNQPQQFLKRYPRVKAVIYDGKKFPFPDESFDIVWSNAVLEHVGSRAEQIFFLQEIKRVGRQAFLTTPNRNFPLEIHTRTPLLHFLPKKIFDAYLRLIGKGWATGNYMNLLSLKSLEESLKKAGINNYQIIKNRLGGFILDLVVIIK